MTTLIERSQEPEARSQDMSAVDPVVHLAGLPPMHASEFNRRFGPQETELEERIRRDEEEFDELSRRIAEDETDPTPAHIDLVIPSAEDRATIDRRIAATRALIDHQRALRDAEREARACAAELDGIADAQIGFEEAEARDLAEDPERWDGMG